MLLSEAFDRYRLDVIVYKNQSKKTEENHLIVKRALLRHFGDISLEELTFEQVRDWKLELDKRRSPETVRNYIIKLRVVLGHTLRLGVPVLDPELIAVPKRTDKVPKFISPEDVDKLLNANNSNDIPKLCQKRNKAVISLLYASGIRVSELISLDRANLHDNSFTIIGKGGKARLCFFDARAEQYINAYLRTRTDNHAALFINKNNTRMSTGNVQEMFQALSKRAGFDVPVTPHVLRHSFSTNFLQNNGNMRYLQALLGHSSLETTQMYAHVVDEDLRGIYTKYHSI